MNNYRDKHGHFTNKENDGGNCHHNGASPRTNPNFDKETYGKYFDKDGKIIPDLFDEWFDLARKNGAFKNEEEFEETAESTSTDGEDEYFDFDNDYDEELAEFEEYDDDENPTLREWSKLKLDELSEALKEAGLDNNVEDSWGDYEMGMRGAALVSNGERILDPREWMDYMNDEITTEELVEQKLNNPAWGDKFKSSGDNFDNDYEEEFAGEDENGYDLNAINGKIDDNLIKSVEGLAKGKGYNVADKSLKDDFLWIQLDNAGDAEEFHKYLKGYLADYDVDRTLPDTIYVRNKRDDNEGMKYFNNLDDNDSDNVMARMSFDDNNDRVDDIIRETRMLIPSGDFEGNERYRWAINRIANKYNIPSKEVKKVINRYFGDDYDYYNEDGSFKEPGNLKWRIGSNKVIKDEEDRLKLKELSNKLNETGLENNIKDSWEDFGLRKKITSLYSGGIPLLNSREWVDYMNGNISADELIGKKIKEPVRAKKLKKLGR